MLRAHLASKNPAVDGSAARFAGGLPADGGYPQLAQRQADAV
jgi:hypothetical protein